MGLIGISRLLRGRGDHEAMNGQTLAEESLKNGRRWLFRDVIALDANASAEVVLQNDFSGDTLRVVAVDIDPDQEISGSVDANVTIDASGTDLPARNDRIDADVATVPSGLTVEHGGTYSGGEASVPLRNSGGVGEGAAKSPVNDIPVAVSQVEPGASERWIITEESGNAQSVTFSAVLSKK